MMAEKSSVNENKQCVIRVLRGHPFSWKSGRGEVASDRMAISPATLSLF
jgi:hypothetical protein